MKTNRLVIASLAIFLASALSAQQTAMLPSQAQRKFMRKKLEYSQKVFEGIVLERYAQVAKNAVQLSRVVDTNAFLFSGDKFYLESAAQFRLDVADLYQDALATNGVDVLS